MKSPAVTVSCLALLVTAPIPKATLRPQTAEAFDRYIQAAESRLERERAGPDFLWVDALPDRRNRVRSGQVVVEPKIGDGDVVVKDGLIHDWIGAVFIPGATMEATLTLAQDYNRHKYLYQPEVQDSRLLSRNGNDFRVYLRLLKKQIVTVVVDTRHDVRYVRLTPQHWYSESRTTSIREVENAGESDERELPAGQDHGVLWRLNSYWRFDERDGGVYVECEAISLTRGVPLGVGWLINPIIRSLPRESLTDTLRETRDALLARRAAATGYTSRRS